MSEERILNRELQVGFQRTIFGGSTLTLAFRNQLAVRGGEINPRFAIPVTSHVLLE
jgi:hypothetical protein